MYVCHFMCKEQISAVILLFKSHTEPGNHKNTSTSIRLTLVFCFGFWYRCTYLCLSILQHCVLCGSINM